MLRRSCLALAFVLPLALAACGPDDPTPATVEEAPGESVMSPESVAGTYRLVGVNENPLPSRIGQMDECEVQLSEGRLRLSADATYDLDVLARAVCDEEEDEEAQMMDRATSEGPYTVEGAELRFLSAVTDAADAEVGEEEPPADEIADEESEDTDVDGAPELYDAKQFAGTGMVQDTLLLVRLDDEVTTLSFVKE